jgi:hypothetical protein
VFGLNKKNNLVFYLKDPEDVYTVIHSLHKNKVDDKIIKVAIELCSNIFENGETAILIIKGNFLHLLIEKCSLNEEKILGLRVAIKMANIMKNISQIKFNTLKFGGLGLKTILQMGYILDYNDNPDFFSIVAYH